MSLPVISALFSLRYLELQDQNSWLRYSSVSLKRHHDHCSLEEKAFNVLAYSLRGLSMTIMTRAGSRLVVIVLEIPQEFTADVQVGGRKRLGLV